MAERGVTALVSIVINNYNYARYLRQAVDSALAQTYRPIEVVVVDDGSTDGSRELLASYGDRIRLIEKPNGGQASAFNVGIAAAQGVYIALLDSDDYLLPHAVSECVAQFPPGYARIYHRLRVVNERGEATQGLPLDAYFRPFDGNIYEAARAGGEFFWAPTSANFFSASALKSVLPVPEEAFRICADAYVLARTGLCGPVRSLDAELAAYRIHSSNNFVSTALAYADTGKVRKYLDDFYRREALLTDACRAAGFAYRRQDEWKDYGLLKGLSVARRWDVSGRHFARPPLGKLLRDILTHTLQSTGSVLARVRRAATLLAILVSPQRTATRVVSYLDTRRSQRTAS
jgi:glycosyltransferase involved in cell wall biosynthesis